MYSAQHESFSSDQWWEGQLLPGRNALHHNITAVLPTTDHARHQIVGLTNLRPAENQVQSNELDSYMYQKIGHHAIDLYAEEMALLFCCFTIRGRCVDTGQI